EQYLLNIQHQLTTNTVAEIGYLGTQGHQLERLYYLNQPVPGTTPVLARAPYPELGIIQEVGNVIDSNYNSLTAKLTRRLSGGLTLLAGYTYSKSIDDGSGLRVIGTDGVHPQDSRCLSCERSLAIFDARQRFVGSVLYDLPVGKGRKYLNRGIASSIIGGWGLSSIVSVSTGFPENIQDGLDRSNTAVGNDRPNPTGISTKLSNPTPNAWLSIQAFAVQPLGTFGNVGRDVLTGPGSSSGASSTVRILSFTD